MNSNYQLFLNLFFLVHHIFLNQKRTVSFLINMFLAGHPPLCVNFSVHLLHNISQEQSCNHNFWYMSKMIISFEDMGNSKSGVEITLGHCAWLNEFATWSVLNFPNFKLCLVILWTRNWKLVSSFLEFKEIYQWSRNNKTKRLYY